MTVAEDRPVKRREQQSEPAAKRECLENDTAIETAPEIGNSIRVGALAIKEQYRRPILAKSGPTIAAQDEEKKPQQQKSEEKFKRKRGQNKAKDREQMSIQDSIKLCFAVADGLECKTEDCKHSHDVEAYLESKGPDIGYAFSFVGEAYPKVINALSLLLLGAASMG